jgi:type IV pili sensor histidine kinase/response regulator
MNVFRPFLVLIALLFTGQAHSATPDNNANTALHSAYFTFDSAALSDQDRKAITRIARVLSPRRSLRLVGYTDDTGPKAYNAYLAQRRAESVRDALIAAGYPRQLLQLESRPGLAANGKRAQLRRVDIFAANTPNEIQANNVSAQQDRLDTADIDPLRIGRYSIVAPVPSEAQRDPLKTLVRITFPRTTRTVGGALRHLLARSGWALANAANADPSLTTLLALPLPETQRHLGPVALIDAVQVLCGNAYDVVIDPVHRLLSCEIKARYAVIHGDTP